MLSIFIIDDDMSLCKMLNEYFTQHGFEVKFFGDISSLRRQLVTQHPDLFLIDMNLGDDDGMCLVQTLVEIADIPIIIMSGDRTADMDRIEGLELGARDYVSKPFSLREMLARVRGALRRSEHSNSEPLKIYTFDGWRLNMRTRQVTSKGGARVKLTKNEINLLWTFLENPNKNLTREHIVRSTRLNDFEIHDRSIDVLILRLRRKMKLADVDADYIITTRGVGYLFKCEVVAEAGARLATV